MIDFKARIRNKTFWVLLFSLIAMIGKTFGIYEVPENYNLLADTILSILVTLGFVVNPATEGIGD